MFRKFIITLLLTTITTATVFCSSGQCMDLVLAMMSSEVPSQAHSCCASSASPDGAGPVGNVPAERSPSESPQDCGGCLFMTDSFDSKWSGANLTVPPAGVGDLPEWLVGSGLTGAELHFWNLSGSLSQMRPHLAIFRHQGAPLAASQARPQLGVFLL